MRIANFMFAVIAFVIAFSPAPASGARTAPGDLETTFNTWLDVINRTDDAPEIEVFIGEHFAPRLIDAYPMSDHVSMFEEIHEDYGTLEFHSFRTQSDDRLEGLLRTGQGQWLLVTL